MGSFSSLVKLLIYVHYLAPNDCPDHISSRNNSISELPSMFFPSARSRFVHVGMNPTEEFGRGKSYVMAEVRASGLRLRSDWMIERMNERFNEGTSERTNSLHVDAPTVEGGSSLPQRWVRLHVG